MGVSRGLRCLTSILIDQFNSLVNSPREVALKLVLKLSVECINCLIFF